MRCGLGVTSVWLWGVCACPHACARVWQGLMSFFVRSCTVSHGDIKRELPLRKFTQSGISSLFMLVSLADRAHTQQVFFTINI